MLPAAAVVALWRATVATGDESPVAKWAEAALDPAAAKSPPLLPALPAAAVVALWFAAHAHANSPVALSIPFLLHLCGWREKEAAVVLLQPRRSSLF